MKIFNTVVIDNETDMEIKAVGCTYNRACEYLAQYGEPDNVETIDTRFTKITYGRVDFYYDEARGYLLRVA
ncbi:MAG: hypothetical protein IKS76_03880 [Paludibacteraceae bacterium]|nr:hypothetical protein [Paludibacteraceae bacterium]